MVSSVTATPVMHDYLPKLRNPLPRSEDGMPVDGMRVLSKDKLRIYGPESKEFLRSMEQKYHVFDTLFRMAKDATGYKEGDADATTQTNIAKSNAELLALQEHQDQAGDPSIRTTQEHIGDYGAQWITGMDAYLRDLSQWAMDVHGVEL